MIELNVITRRRLANFKANKRGYYSLLIFLTLYMISLCSEFIANDKPIVMSLKGEIYFPVVFEYTEIELGGALRTEADYRDPFMVELIQENGWALWPPVRYSYDTIHWDIDVQTPAPPSREHLLGSTSLARDVLANLLYGFRLSVTFGLTLTIVSSIVGVTVGGMQGYFGGLLDLLGQRFVEIWAGLPLLFLLIIISSMIEPGTITLLLVLMMFGWMSLVAVVRAEFLRARNFEFIKAARALGVSNLTIMRKHVLPNAMVATLTFLPFILNSSITLLTALDFLGFGLPSGSASLGQLLAEGKSNLSAPWLGLTGFFTLAIMLTLLIFVGEAVRDAFDPRKTNIELT